MSLRLVFFLCRVFAFAFSVFACVLVLFLVHVCYLVSVSVSVLVSCSHRRWRILSIVLVCVNSTDLALLLFI